VLRNIIEVNAEKSFFQLLFMKYNEDQRIEIEVEEVEELDFGEVKKRLKLGETVAIKPKRKQKLNTNMIAKKDAAAPWYFTHV